MTRKRSAQPCFVSFADSERVERENRDPTRTERTGRRLKVKQGKKAETGGAGSASSPGCLRKEIGARHVLGGACVDLGCADVAVPCCHWADLVRGGDSGMGIYMTIGWQEGCF